MLRPGLIILAAGGSTRMGQPKQLLPWENSTLLRCACETALMTACHPVVVVLGCEAARCQAEISDLAVQTVINDQWQLGMGTSVSRGITEIENSLNCPAALLMLVDQPGITAKFLLSLLEPWQRDPELIVATRYREGGGVPALIPKRHFSELRSLSGDQGARSVIAKHNRVILAHSSASLLDLDTNDQYQKSYAASRC